MENSTDNRKLGASMLTGLIELVVLLLLVVFAPAGTLHWWQGWAFFAVFLGLSLIVIAYFSKRDPHLLANRISHTEQRGRQMWIAGALRLTWCVSVILPGLDHRFHWSHLSAGIAILGDVLVVAGYAAIFLALRENTFAASTVKVESEQRVISTGPYALLRHPMYAGAVLMFVGTPLALGSLWGLLIVPPLLVALVARLLDEERFLREQLPGYKEYVGTVRHRLVPYVW
jgi:protein-S-isoprenylcysteine O-methyltransferase Ste14